MELAAEATTAGTAADAASAAPPSRTGTGEEKGGEEGVKEEEPGPPDGIRALVVVETDKRMCPHPPAPPEPPPTPTRGELEEGEEKGLG